MKTYISTLIVLLCMLSCATEKTVTTKVNITIGNQYATKTISGQNATSSKKAYSGYTRNSLSSRMVLETDTNLAPTK